MRLSYYSDVKKKQISRDVISRLLKSVNTKLSLTEIFRGTFYPLKYDEEITNEPQDNIIECITYNYLFHFFDRDN